VITLGTSTVSITVLSHSTLATLATLTVCVVHRSLFSVGTSVTRGVGIASAGSVDDGPDRGTRRERGPECEDSAGDPTSEDQLLAIYGDCRFDGLVFLNHVRHPFGLCVSHEHCLPRGLTFPIRFLNVD
jgi:hypothetical protein